MQGSSANILKRCVSDLLEFVEACTSKEELHFCDTKIKTLAAEFRRGSNLKIIVCGHAKSGKSTLLNYLLSSDPKDLKDESGHILLTGEDVETSTPWIIQDTITLSPGKISVDHQDYKGDIGGYRVFDQVPELHTYLKETYSRVIIDKIMEKDQRHPYNYIRISFGRPNLKLNQALLTGALTMIDTQDLEEPGVDSLIKAMEPPSILICCFDVSKDLLLSEEYAFFKSFIRSLPNTHLIFMCTHVEAKLDQMQKLQNETTASNRSNRSNIDILQKLEGEIRYTLTEEFPTKFPEVFFFDPSSSHDPLRSGAEKLRERLVALRQELDIDSFFYHDMKELLKEGIIAIQDELYILSGKQLEIHTSTSSNERQKQEANRKFQILSEKLEASFKAKLDSSLIEEVVKLTEEKRGWFMKHHPFSHHLRKKIIKWLSNDGIKTAISSLFNEKLSEFFEDHKADTQKFGKINPFPINTKGLVTPLITLGAFVHLASLIMHIGGALDGGQVKEDDFKDTMGLVVDTGGLIDNLKFGQFEADGLTLAKTITERLLAQKAFTTICKETAAQCIEKMEKGDKILDNQMSKELLDYLKKIYGIDCYELDKIKERLDQIK